MLAWSTARASGTGATAALLALLLWPFFRRFGGALAWPFAILAAIAGLCGLAILLVTLADMLFRRRGASIRPARGFDLVLGTGLVALSLLQLDDLQGQLPA
jgi:hypothetical protein